MRELKRQARESMKFRNHTPELRFHHYTKTWAGISCTKCGREVQVNSHPMPNQIDIGGYAVAMDCEK